MNSPYETDSLAKALASSEERARDVAAEELGDIIERYHGRTSLELQAALDALGATLEAESSQLVMESILNAISKAKYHEVPLHLPLAVVRRRLPSYEGSALEHAQYILEGT